MPRPRKGPHLYRRRGRPGLWGYIDRDRKDIPLGTEDEAEALQILGELVGDHQSRGILGSAPAATEPLGKLFDECERRAKVESTPKTAYELGRDLHRVATWCLGQRLADAVDITAQHIADFKEFRRQSIGERTGQKVGASRVNREVSAWKRAMKIAVERKTVPPSTLSLFTLLRQPHAAPRQRSLSKKELTEFFKGVADLNLRALLRATLGTAMRDEEIRHLSADWIKARSITIGPQAPGSCPCHQDGWKTKGFRYRDIPITPRTKSALNEVVAALEAGWAIPCERWVWEQIKRACAAAKIARFSMHDLRHAGASHWLADGIDIATISKWLGHRDVLTTQRYLHVVVDESDNRKRLTW